MHFCFQTLQLFVLCWCESLQTRSSGDMKHLRRAGCCLFAYRPTRKAHNAIIVSQVPGSSCQFRGELLGLGWEHTKVEPKVNGQHVVAEILVQQLQLLLISGIQLAHVIQCGKVICSWPGLTVRQGL